MCYLYADGVSSSDFHMNYKPIINIKNGTEFLNKNFQQTNMQSSAIPPQVYRDNLA